MNVITPPHPTPMSKKATKVRGRLPSVCQLHYTNYITPQLQLHYATTTTTVAVHHTTSSSCGWGDHCNHCNHSSKHNSNHLSVNQWIRSAIRDSQQPTSPIGFLFWNFRHRLVRYYWYMYIVKLGRKYSEWTRNLFTFAAFSTHQARELAELEVRDVEFKNFLDMTLSKLLELNCMVLVSSVVWMVRMSS